MGEKKTKKKQSKNKTGNFQHWWSEKFHNKKNNKIKIKIPKKVTFRLHELVKVRIATSLESLAAVLSRAQADENLSNLRRCEGVKILHEVDATQLDAHQGTNKTKKQQQTNNNTTMWTKLKHMLKSLYYINE